MKRANTAVVSEQESHEQQDKLESQPAAMPDYAAGLLAPSFDVSVSNHVLYNPLEPGVIMQLHFKCSAPYWSDLPFVISDIRALWRSGLIARVSFRNYKW